MKRKERNNEDGGEGIKKGGGGGGGVSERKSFCIPLLTCRLKLLTKRN